MTFILLKIFTIIPKRDDTSRQSVWFEELTFSSPDNIMTFQRSPSFFSSSLFNFQLSSPLFFFHTHPLCPLLSLALSSCLCLTLKESRPSSVGFRFNFQLQRVWERKAYKEGKRSRREKDQVNQRKQNIKRRVWDKGRDPVSIWEWRLGKNCIWRGGANSSPDPSCWFWIFKKIWDG